MSRFDDGYTGHLFEKEILGTCLVAHRGYMRWQDAAEMVRKNQPRMKTRVAERLEGEVSRQFGKRVTLFTAVGSTLDCMHGVDGFFEFEGAVVTIDLTTNPHKDSTKADLLVHQDDIENLPHLAGRVVREMKTKMVRRRA